MTEKLLLGSDPEFFFLKRSQIVPPFFLLGEGKEIKWKSGFPYRIYEDIGEIAITSDGAAFELVLQPQEDWEKLFDLIAQGIRMTEKMVKRDNLKLGVVPAAKIPDKYLIDETVISGCDPDYDALDIGWHAQECLEDDPYRYAGAHMHIGFVDSDMREFAQKNIIPLIQLLGIYVGIPSLIHSTRKSKEALRLNKYGKPAKYRLPKHGIEYRSTSNNWIINKPLAATLFENIERVVEIFKHPTEGRKILDAYVENLARGFKDQDLALLKSTYNDAIKLI